MTLVRLAKTRGDVLAATPSPLVFDGEVPPIKKSRAPRVPPSRAPLCPPVPRGPRTPRGAHR